MNKFKMVFNQTLMISSGILFFIGIQELIGHLFMGWGDIVWPWYMPLSFVLAGFLCSIPSLILFSVWDKTNKKVFIAGIVIHFITEGVIVTLCGFFFGWFKSISQFIAVLSEYALTYAFVWLSMLFIYRKDDKKINEAIKEIRDEE